jgi:hypothetical protein
MLVTPMGRSQVNSMAYLYSSTEGLDSNGRTVLSKRRACCWRFGFKGVMGTKGS